MSKQPTLPRDWHQQQLAELETMQLTLSQMKRTPSRCGFRHLSKTLGPGTRGWGGGGHEVVCLLP